MTVPTVVQAVAAVARDAGAVGKDGDSGQGYTYRRVDDVINALHGPLCEHGVVIVPHVVDYQSEPMDRKNWTRTALIVEFVVVGPAGDTLPVPVRAVGESHNNSDKGPGAAMSYAWKSAMSQLFSLPTDDPAMDIEHQAPVESDPDKAARTELAAQIGAAPDDVKAAMGEWLKSQRLTLRHPLETGQLDQISNMFDEIAQTGAGASADPTRPGSADGAADEGETTNEGEHE